MRQCTNFNPVFSAPLSFNWVDAQGHNYSYIPRITPQGLQIGTPMEELPGFFFFASNQTVSARENAERFSALSRNRQERKFVKLFVSEFDWIEDLNIEVSAGLPVIHATVRGIEPKIPLNLVSGGINRIVSIMLAIA